MKKGEKAKLDVNWWKKNKSIRLRSKAFDTALAEYIKARDEAERRKDNPDFWLAASNLALAARSEARQLTGKCGLKQDETKAVLDDYVKLLEKEGKDANKQHLAHVKSATKAEDKVANEFSKLEKALARTTTRIEKLEKVVDQMTTKADQLIKDMGAKMFKVNVATITKTADALDNDIEKAAWQIKDAYEKGKTGSTPPVQVDKAVKAADATLARGYRLQTEISGLRMKAEAALAEAG